MRTPMMDLSIVMPWIGAALSILALLSQIKTALSAGERKLDDRLKGAEDTIIHHDRRIQTVESEIKHLPDKDSVHRLQVDMTELKGHVATMAKSSEATERATRRVEEFLLNNKAS